MYKIRRFTKTTLKILYFLSVSIEYGYFPRSWDANVVFLETRNCNGVTEIPSHVVFRCNS